MILISSSIVLLLDREFNHSRKCLEVPICEKLDSQNIWHIQYTILRSHLHITAVTPNKAGRHGGGGGGDFCYRVYVAVTVSISDFWLKISYLLVKSCGINTHQIPLVTVSFCLRHGLVS